MNYLRTLWHIIVNKILGVSSKAYGTIDGRLLIIDLHGRWKFSIYDEVTNKEIKCHFDEEMYAEVMMIAGANTLISKQSRPVRNFRKTVRKASRQFGPRKVYSATNRIKRFVIIAEALLVLQTGTHRPECPREKFPFHLPTHQMSDFIRGNQ